MSVARFAFRPLAVSDLELLHEWLNRPHVAEWFGGPTSFDEVRADYTEHIESTWVSPMLAYLEGAAVGYVQSYEVMGASGGWWPDETDPGARGIDQFLANESQLGRGLGAQMVFDLISRLFGDPAVTKVQTDPSPDNARAIRAYEKAGFRRVGEVVTPDGPALLMVVHRADWQARTTAGAGEAL